MQFGSTPRVHKRRLCVVRAIRGDVGGKRRCVFDRSTRSRKGRVACSSISDTDRADTGRGLNGSKRQNVTSIAYGHYVGSIESSTAPVTRNSVSLGADWPHKVATPRMVGYYENEVLAAVIGELAADERQDRQRGRRGCDDGINSSPNMFIANTNRSVVATRPYGRAMSRCSSTSRGSKIAEKVSPMSMALCRWHFVSAANAKHPAHTAASIRVAARFRGAACPISRPPINHGAECGSKSLVFSSYLSAAAGQNRTHWHPRTFAPRMQRLSTGPVVSWFGPAIVEGSSVHLRGPKR